MIGITTVPWKKWLRPKHPQYIPRLKGSAVSTQDILDPIGPISSTIPSPWVQPLPKGRSDITPRALLIVTFVIMVTINNFIFINTVKYCSTLKHKNMAYILLHCVDIMGNNCNLLWYRGDASMWIPLLIVFANFSNMINFLYLSLLVDGLCVSAQKWAWLRSPNIQC